MPNLVQQLTDLRESLRSVDAAQTNKFARVFGTFLALNESAGLMDVSKPFKDKSIRALLELVARRHAGDPKLGIQGMQMLRHAPTGLVHGAFFAGRSPATFFYFVKEQQGLVAFGAGMTMHYYRITASELPPPGTAAASYS